MTLDDELRDALQAEADQSQPSPDGWERLQERVGSAKGRRTRVWLPVRPPPSWSWRPSAPGSS